MQEWPPSLHFLAPRCPQHPPHTFLQWDPSPFQRWLLQPQTLSRPIKVCASRLLSLRPRQWMVPSVPHPASAGKTLLYPASSQPWTYMDFWLVYSLFTHCLQRSWLWRPPLWDEWGIWPTIWRRGESGWGQLLGAQLLNIHIHKSERRKVLWLLLLRVLWSRWGKATFITPL